jgi:hypothetical protein
MARGGRESNTSEISIFPLFHSLSLSPLSIPLSFSGMGKEVRRGWQIMRMDVGVRKGNCQL